MRLIDQEDGSILFPGCFRVSEKAGETDPGVKDIIIIADNDIREIRRVKGQLIGAYTVLFSTVRDLLCRYGLSALRTVQQISERPIDPVIVAVCPGQLEDLQSTSSQTQERSFETSSRLRTHSPRS